MRSGSGSPVLSSLCTAECCSGGLYYMQEMSWHNNGNDEL